MKKVLVISYYWPPSGGSGVQRWLKFVKYLPQFGWIPYVFTPENPAFPIKDPSLLNDVPKEAEVIRFPIWEPYETFFKVAGLAGKRKSENPNAMVTVKSESLFHKISTWIRGNFMIPDPRMFWIHPSVKYLESYLNKNSINIIVTTGPPHSMHRIGYFLKKKNPNLIWIADFRDPWSEWGLMETLRVSKFVKTIHRRLEQQVLRTADELITVTDYYVKRFELLSDKKVHLISNGFDEDDFKNIQYKKTEKFYIRHAGIVNEKSNPIPFMNAVRVLAEENSEFRKSCLVEFVGEVHPVFREFIAKDEILKEFTKFIPTIPHHQLIELYGETSVLLLIITEHVGAEGYTHGKSYEYIATGVPILAVGPPEGDAAKLLRETSSGEIFSSAEPDKIKKALLKLFEQWKSGEGKKRVVNDTYSRKKLSQQLATLLDSKVDAIN